MGMKKGLASKLDITLSEILSYDLLLGVCGGAGGIYLAFHSPSSLHNVEGVAVGVVGVVIGTVVAGIAVIAAFLDTQFLRKIHQIGKRAERYVSPFAFTAAIGVISSLFLVFSIALPPHAPKWLMVTSAGASGLFTVWTLASFIPLLSNLMDFVGLKGDAAEVPDDVESNIQSINRQNKSS